VGGVRINQSHNLTWAIGLDLGGTALKYAIVSSTGEVIAPGILPSRAQDGRQAVFTQLRSAGLSMLRGAHAHGIRPLVLGLGTPGTVDQETGIVGGALPNMPGWRGTNVIADLSAELGLPCFADNDANLMTLAEAVFGAGQGFDTVFGITLGTGIGGGLVLQGQIYRGSGSAGELGHTSVVADGRLCGCGRRGCLELYAAAPQLTERYRDVTGSMIEPSAVLQRWDDGDAAADNAVRNLAHWFGIGVGNALNLLHPSCLVLGGGLMDSGETLLRLLQQTILEYCLPDIAASVQIRRALLGNRAGVVGAAVFALDCFEERYQ
jgi:glucokinase-like ROK family protein